MRRGVIAGLALLALVGGLLLWNRSASRAARANASGQVGAGKPATAPAKPAPAAPPKGTMDVHGRIQDQRGFDLSEEDGTMQLLVDGADGAVEVKISREGWRATVPAGATLTFEDIQFGDRKAVATPATIPVSEWGMDIHCRWLVPTLLRVIGEKGENLDAVELVEDTSPEGDLVPPDDKERVVAGGSSPVELACSEGAHTYWVRARDHAWSRITVSVGFGGERIVRLVRAGALDVRLTPYDPESEIAIQLIRLGTVLCRDHPDESGHARIEGLPPGLLTVAAGDASAWDERAWKKAEVEIEPGKTRELMLAVGDLPPSPELVPIEGTLEVDPGWPKEKDDSSGGCDVTSGPGFSVVSAAGGFFAADSSLNEEDGTWSAGPIPPGRYFVLLRDWAFAQAVDVGPSGNTAVRIVVPPPCDIEVHLVDAGTGEPIPDEGSLSWSVKSPEVGPDFGRTYVWCEREQPCVRPGIYKFRAPLGTLVVGLWNDLYWANEVEVALKPGLNRIDLKAVWNLSFDLALRDGAMSVPVDPGFSDRIQVAALDGEGNLEECGTGERCRVWVTKPGHYRVSFPAEIEGYEPIAPVEVDVAPGKIPRIEVPLKRRER